MSKRSCVAAESLAEAFLRMARGTVTFQQFTRSFPGTDSMLA